jgi:hypothetical protein
LSGLVFVFCFLLALGLDGFARILSMNPGVKSDSVDEDDSEDDESNDKRFVAVVWFGNIMDKGFVMSMFEMKGF